MPGITRTAAAARSIVHVSTPTWANHIPLIGGSGLKLANYVYYDAASGGLNFTGMLKGLEKLPAGSGFVGASSATLP